LFYYAANNPNPILIGVVSSHEIDSGVIGLKPMIFANVGTQRKWIDETMAKI
jgi:hypothetical protein